MPCGRCLNRIATSVQNLGCWENGRNECRQALAEGAATLVGAILNKSLSELFKGHGARSFLAVRAGDARSDRRCFRALIMQQTGHRSSASPDGSSRPAYGLIQLRPPSPSVQIRIALRTQVIPRRSGAYRNRFFRLGVNRSLSLVCNARGSSVLHRVHSMRI